MIKCDSRMISKKQLHLTFAGYLLILGVWEPGINVGSCIIIVQTRECYHGLHWDNRPKSKSGNPYV